MRTTGTPTSGRPIAATSPFGDALVISALVLSGAVACSGSSEACTVCMQEKCADLIRPCEGDTDCACMVDCTGQQGIPGISGCLATCGLTERPPGFATIETCTATACPDSEDECSTPADWTPPPDDVMCEGSALPIGGGGLPDCSFDVGLGFDPEGTILQLESADHAVCARIERRNDGSGTLANTKWTLIGIRVGPPGEVAHVDDTASCWYSSHHNFSDWLHAWSGTRHFDLKLAEDGHGGPRTYELYVFEEGAVDTASCAPSAEGSRCIAGPIELLPVNP